MTALCRAPPRPALGKDCLFFLKKKFFAESLAGWLSAKIIYLFIWKKSLPRALQAGARQKIFIYFFEYFFAECLVAGSRQS